MTVSALITRNDITATASQTSFTYTFRVLAATDMDVYQNGVLLSSGYTVNNVGTTTGGTVVLDVGASVGQIVSLVLAMPLDRTTDYQNSGKFLADDVNEDFDKIYIGAIQNENLNDRSLRLKDVEPPTSGVDMTIPLKDDRKGKFLAFDSTTGRPIATAGTSSSDSASWVAYNFTGNGSTTAFTLGSDPATENNTQVYIDGVYQQKDGYSVAGAILTFSAAPPNLSTIEVMVASILPIGSTVDQPTRADLVSYTPAGTGAVATTVQTKLRETVSVKDFGFDGTGGTDNTVKFNNMLSSLSGLSSVVIRFPAGQYHFATKPNNISSSISIVGDGIANTRLFRDFTVSSASQGLFNFVAGANGSSVSQMSIESNGVPSLSGCLISLIANSSGAPDFCRFSNLYLTSNNTDNYKIYIDGSLRTSSPTGVRDTFISNCSIFGGSIAGVYAKSVVALHMTSCDTFPAGGTSGKIVITGTSSNKSNYVNIDGASIDGAALDNLNFGNLNSAVFSANITNASSADTVIVQGSLASGVTVQQFWVNSIFLSNSGTPNDFLIGGKARGSILQVTDGVSVPSTESGFASIYIDTADGDLKIKFGDGTVKTISTDT